MLAIVMKLWNHNAPVYSLVGTEIEFDTKQCDKFGFNSIFSPSLSISVYDECFATGWDFCSQNKHTNLISFNIKGIPNSLSIICTVHVLKYEHFHHVILNKH